jgi:hypothetical protein
MPDRSHTTAFLDLLRGSPRLRALLYLALAGGSAEAVNALVYDPDDPHASIHYTLLPIVVGLTAAFAQLTPEDAPAWKTPPGRKDLADLGRGALLGSAAILGFIGIAVARGWASAPRWGWEAAPPAEIARTIARQSLENAVTVWNEEMVFHGYGFDTLRQGFGLTAAVVISTVLFSLYHGLGVRRTIALALLGLVFLLLRLESGSLWMPIGFHWAWNMGQNALFGNPANGPSIRPLEVHGPEAWIGRPGALQPGWLVIIYLGVLAVWLVWRRVLASTRP